MRLDLCPRRVASLLVASETMMYGLCMSDLMESSPQRFNERSSLTASFLQPFYSDGLVFESSTMTIEPLFEDAPDAEDWCNYLCPKIYMSLLMLVLVVALLTVIILSSR
ncbi:MAG: hypothetical protein KVP17_003392 [Porospora cf. gigantea B]|uniref:uncharacterized protein n=1 Tax=Porospora cf. gigantea B TaxID=2853592 RepID=UPI003571A424|nr:MAG: hypothetical protein KVP17_003392 [Porospora cf. gigantea B]